MTIDTVLTGRDMVERLTGRNRTVMAGFAIICDTRMGERYIQEIRGAVVTVLARLSIGVSRYVVCEFTDTDPVIVTGVTATDHAGMIVSTRGKSTRGMAIGTVLVIRRRRHVCVEKCTNRFTAGGARSVGNMATVGTATADAGVIDAKGWRETIGVMA